MRRSDREITDLDDIERIINKCSVCRLGMTDGRLPYVVPLNFGFERVDDDFIFYFHGANEGQKVDMLGKNPNVCVELDIMYRISGGPSASSITSIYESVIGFGRIEMLDDSEKLRAMSVMTNKYVGNHSLDNTIVITDRLWAVRLKVDRITGKRNPEKEGFLSE